MCHPFFGRDRARVSSVDSNGHGFRASTSLAPHLPYGEPGIASPPVKPAGVCTWLMRRRYDSAPIIRHSPADVNRTRRQPQPSANPVMAVLQSEPKFSQMFVAHLLTRNNRSEEDLIDLLFNSSEKRLARLLLLLANFGKEGSPEPIDANFDQQTLADMIGTTRSRGRLGRGCCASFALWSAIFSWLC
jgi:hypothetical protein